MKRLRTTNWPCHCSMEHKSCNSIPHGVLSASTMSSKPLVSTSFLCRKKKNFEIFFYVGTISNSIGRKATKTHLHGGKLMNHNFLKYYFCDPNNNFLGAEEEGVRTKMKLIFNF
jgi:hypothetical protein